MDAAWKEEDMTPALSALANALEDKNNAVKQNATEALVYHYLHKRDEKGFRKLVDHKDLYVKDSATWALRAFISHYSSKVALYLSKMALIATVKYRNAQLVESIAKRKAELAKEMEGEILLGETVKPPRNRRRVYRITKRLRQ